MPLLEKTAISAGDCRIVGLASRDLVAELTHGTMVSAIEIKPDQLKHVSTQTWTMSLTRITPVTVI